MTKIGAGWMVQRARWSSMRAGDVVWVDFGDPVGSEPEFLRPVVVLTADGVLEAGPRTIHCVPVTSNVRRSMPTEVRVMAAGLADPSVAQAHLCTVVSTDRIVRTGGCSVGAGSLAQLRSLVSGLLDLP